MAEFDESRAAPVSSYSATASFNIVASSANAKLATASWAIVTSAANEYRVSVSCPP